MTLLLTLLCAWTLSLGASICSAAPSAIQTSTEIQLANEFLRVSLDSNTGSINAIIDLASGLNLTNLQQGYRALWGIKLSTTDQAPFADNNSSGKPTVTLANSVDMDPPRRGTVQ
jgi:hypothetical protein